MKSKEHDIWETLEKGFGGGSKFRILAHLILHPDEAFTRYALVKATGLRTPTVEEHLKVLVELGWIKQYPFTPRTYQINLENEVAKEVSKMFQRLKYLEGKP